MIKIIYFSLLTFLIISCGSEKNRLGKVKLKTPIIYIQNEIKNSLKNYSIYDQNPDSNKYVFDSKFKEGKYDTLYFSISAPKTNRTVLRVKTNTFYLRALITNDSIIEIHERSPKIYNYWRDIKKNLLGTHYLHSNVLFNTSLTSINYDSIKYQFNSGQDIHQLSLFHNIKINTKNAIFYADSLFCNSKTLELFNVGIKNKNDSLFGSKAILTLGSNKIMNYEIFNLKGMANL